MKIQQKIKEVREQKNISQKDFAQSIGMSLSRLQKIEKGEIELAATKVHEICKSLKITAVALLDDDYSINVEFCSLANQVLNIIMSGYHVKGDYFSIGPHIVAYISNSILNEKHAATLIVNGTKYYSPVRAYKYIDGSGNVEEAIILLKKHLSLNKTN